MAKRVLLGQSKKRFLVIKRGSVSIDSFIEILALRDRKISKILARIFRNLCPVKRGPHPTIIISSRYFNRSISCAIKKKWFSLYLPEILSYGSHVYQKSILAMSSFGGVSLLLMFQQGQTIFWCFSIASQMMHGGWRLKPLPHLSPVLWSGPNISSLFWPFSSSDLTCFPNVFLLRFPLTADTLISKHLFRLLVPV